MIKMWLRFFRIKIMAIYFCGLLSYIALLSLLTISIRMLNRGII